MHGIGKPEEEKKLLRLWKESRTCGVEGMGESGGPRTERSGRMVVQYADVMLLEEAGEDLLGNAKHRGSTQGINEASFQGPMQ